MALQDHLGSPESIRETLRVFEMLTPDTYLQADIAAWKDHLVFGRRFWEICIALNVLAKRLRPTRYMEIGVRRGRSMAQVGYQVPDCEMVGFDSWIPNYAGQPNPGPEFVREELSRVGFRGPLTLIDGDSHETVPAFFANAKVRPELITVDGDHSQQGAWDDLLNVVPILAPGGTIIFDDLIHPQFHLLPVWKRFQKQYAGAFDFMENLQDKYGTGIAIKGTV